MTRKRVNIVAHSLVKFSLFLLVLFGGIGFYLTTLLAPVSKKDQSQSEFEIKKGDSTLSIANSLKSKNLIRSPFMFRLVVKQSGLGGKLQAGFFILSPSQSTREIAQSLTKGMTKSQKLTIPEGYRLEQIAETAGFSRAEFMAVAKGMEGTLFPDTYFLKEGITAKELVDLMHANYLKKVGEIDKNTLILASLIERETRGNAEKPVVAGILSKRLASGWALELDATIQYSLGKPGDWWPNTTLLDRKLPSAYNTYLHQGLPPTPICNPGIDSINAAKNPQDSPYWFYLHDREGGIHYGVTNADHSQNIAKYIN